MYLRILVPLLALALSISSLAVIPRRVSAGDVEDYTELEQQYFRTFAQGRFADAEKLSRQLLTISKRSFPRFVVHDLSRVGDCRNALGEYADAIEFYSQALEIMKTYKPQNEIERLGGIGTVNNSLIGLGACHHHLAHYEQAIGALQQAIEWNVKFDQNPAMRAKAMNILALTYGKQHETAKAHKTYAETVAFIEPVAVREPQPGLPTLMLATTLHNWAILHKEAGHYDLAEPLLRRALRLIVSAVGWNNAETGNFAATLASTYYQQGRADEALPLLRYAIEVQETLLGAEHPYTLVAVGKLGDLYFFQEDFASAEPLYRRVIAGYERRLGPDHPELCSPLWMLGRCLALQQRGREAEAELQRGVAVCEKHLGPNHVNTIQTLMWLAWCEAGQGKDQESFERATKTLQLGENQPLPGWLTARLHDLRAAHYWAQGKRDEAFAAAELASHAIEQGRWHTGGGEVDRAAAFQEAIRSHYDRLLQWRIELGDLEQVFQTIETIKARTFLEELETKGLDYLAGLSPEERAKIQNRESELRQTLSAAELRFGELPLLGPQPDPAAVQKQQRLASEVNQARQSLYEHLAEVRRSSHVYQQLMARQRQATRVADVQQKLLAENELLLLYRIGSTSSHVLAIRPQKVQIYELKIDDVAAQTLGLAAGPVGEEELASVLVTGKDSVLSALSSPKSGSTANAKLAALTSTLLPADERAALLSGEVKRLTIVPDGPLSLLPFEALITKLEPGEEPQYLLDVGPPIAYAPSASVLLNLATRETTAMPAREPVLTLGDPAYAVVAATTQDAVDRRMGVTRAADRFRAGLTRLPHSGLESIWVKQLCDKADLPAVQLTGALATEGQLRSLISGRQIIHLACHGMADQRYGNLFGALAVAPGKPGNPRDDGTLSMSELYELDLSGCELAILSACETNYGPQQRGEGVWALSRGFLVAGSRRVVASNWVVDDRAGATLISYFTNYLTRDGKDPALRNYAAALHKARQQVRKEEQWKHPFYWSSLVLVGPK